MKSGKITPLPSSIILISLDELADDIMEAIYTTFNGLARRSLMHNIGNPWLTDTCKAARHKYKAKIRQNLSFEEDRKAKKQYRLVIKKAKEIYYRNEIEEFISSKDIFSMIELHQTKRIYRSSH